jgi:hypothetical protein
MQAKYENLLAIKETAFKRELESVASQFAKTVTSYNKESHNATVKVCGASPLASHLCICLLTYI